MQTLWFWIVSLMISLYAILDGFDFGAGVLHLFVAKTNEERRQVLNSIGPFWDGNEVWLLAASGALFLAFPRVLASGFSGFYLAMFLVVWTLILRGIAIEFRSHVENILWRTFWDTVFAASSILMPVLLGTALGNILRGVPLDSTGYFNIPLFTQFVTRNPVGILDWYTVQMGVFVLLTVTGHGSLFLAWKTVGSVQKRAVRAALPLWLSIAAMGLAITSTTAYVNPELYVQLRQAPLAWLGLSLFVAGLALVFWAHFRRRWLLAFVGSATFILGLLVATAACLFPIMLKSSLQSKWSLTAYTASANTGELRTAMWWWLLGFPLVTGYFAFLFRIHRGKTEVPADGKGY